MCFIQIQTFAARSISIILFRMPTYQKNTNSTLKVAQQLSNGLAQRDQFRIMQPIITHFSMVSSFLIFIAKRIGKCIKSSMMSVQFGFQSAAFSSIVHIHSIPPNVQHIHLSKCKIQAPFQRKNFFSILAHSVEWEYSQNV